MQITVNLPHVNCCEVNARREPVSENFCFTWRILERVGEWWLMVDVADKEALSYKQNKQKQNKMYEAS